VALVAGESDGKVTTLLGPDIAASEDEANKGNPVAILGC
jgi:hypothetical protein